MKKPTIEEAESYAKEKGLTLDIEHWWHTNNAKGWVVMTKQGPIPMKNWKSNLHTWQHNQRKYEDYKGGFREKYIRSQQNHSGNSQ
jgi:hypothetical protein